MKNVLLSYPRSGNTWARYCLEVLTKKPTSYPESVGDNPIGERLEIGVDLSAEHVAYKSHNISDTDDIRLLVIVRDFKEAIPRHFLEIEGKPPPFMQYFKSQTNGKTAKGVDYIKILQQYDDMVGPKRLLYYEDLIRYPYDTIKSLVSFFDQVVEAQFEAFWKSFDAHKKQGLNAYHATSRTEGNVAKLKWHQSKLGHQDIQLMISHVKTNYPIIWDKYLKRYE